LSEFEKVYDNHADAHENSCKNERVDCSQNSLES
jgi:hypothetical protein